MGYVFWIRCPVQWYNINGIVTLLVMICYYFFYFMAYMISNTIQKIIKIELDLNGELELAFYFILHGLIISS